MKSITIIFLINLFCSIISPIPNWYLDNQALDYFPEGTTYTSWDIWTYNNNNDGINVQLKVTMTKDRTTNKVTTKNYVIIYEGDNKKAEQEVSFNDIHSHHTNQLKNNLIICPKGKFHPYYFNDNYNYKGFLIPPNFIEFGDWDLRCFKHITGHFLIFYRFNSYKNLYDSTNNGDYRDWTGNEYIYTTLYDFQLENSHDGDDNNYRYKFPLLKLSGDYIRLVGGRLLLNHNSGNGDYALRYYEDNGYTDLIEAKKYGQGYFDSNYQYYFFTYNNASDFSSGYSNTNVDGGNGYTASGMSFTKNQRSPLSFVDNVEVNSTKFIQGTSYVYYTLNDKDTGKNLIGLIDIKQNKVLVNIEDEVKQFFPVLSGDSFYMILITSTSAYKLCVLKPSGLNNDCSQTCSDTNLILDPNINKCQANCDSGKIKMMPEGICFDKSMCDLTYYMFNDGETECGLCNYFYPTTTKYRFPGTGTPQCLDIIPAHATCYNSDASLLKCEDNYHFDNYKCLPDFCYERCETCDTASSDDDNQGCTKCKEGYVLEDGNCNIPQTPTTIITTLPTTIITTIPTTIITTIPTTIITTIPTTIITTIPTTIITTIPTTIITTIPTTIITTIPTTIITTIPTTITTTIPTTIVTSILTTIPTTVPTTIITTIPTTFITTIPTTVITTIPTTIFTTIPTTEVQVDISEDCEEKCLTCNEASKSKGLCLSCNEDKGYRKVNYTKVLTQFYDCLLNTSSAINKYYYNEETKIYRPCYKTCKRCAESGNEQANHCLECENGYMFRPGNNPYNNCVVYSDFYYISPYNQYKALKILQCPEESPYMVKAMNKSYCIYDCKRDETYKYLYNGICVKQCPENTYTDNVNYLCKSEDDKCKLGKNQIDDEYIVNQESTRLLIRNYIIEFNYTQKYVSLYQNSNYRILIYKARECINELSLETPKVDFQQCYNKVKKYYNISEDLIIVIIDKKEKGASGQTYYSFYHPTIGYKLEAEEICKNDTIVVTQNLTSILTENKETFTLQSSLTDQGINIFNLNDPFYTDLCYDFENPYNRDIPLSERISTIYPDVSLCDDGCKMSSIDLVNMTADCDCKFNDIANSNIIKENALLDSMVGEVFDLINSSNILVMKCYKYIFKYFTDSFGGIISMISLSGHIICSLIYFFYGMGKIKAYVYNIFEKFMDFIGEKALDMEGNPPKKNKLRTDLINNRNSIKFNDGNILVKKSPSPSPYLETNFDKDKRKIRIEKPMTKNYDTNNTFKEIELYRESMLHGVENNDNNYNQKKKKLNSKLTKIDNKISKFKPKIKNKKLSLKIKNTTENNFDIDEKYKEFFDEYLATSLDDLEYDDAVVKDGRSFCEYLIECLKEKQMICFTFIASDPIKIRIIKIMLFILNVMLYFVVTGLFFSEDYIKTLYHISKEDDNFFSYIGRSIDKFLYTTMVSIVIGYIIDCFFVDENKIKGIFKREKDNVVNLKKEIAGIIRDIKTRYLTFIIIIFVLLFISFYYLLCFNYVYPKTQIEWIKASITIFIIMQILSVLKCFAETCLRFLAFKCNSEKIYKISKLLD